MCSLSKILFDYFKKKNSTLNNFSCNILAAHIRNGCYTGYIALLIDETCFIYRNRINDCALVQIDRHLKGTFQKVFQSELIG